MQHLLEIIVGNYRTREHPLLGLQHRIVGLGPNHQVLVLSDGSEGSDSLLSTCCKEECRTLRSPITSCFHCDRSSISVCRLLLRTQDKLRSVQRLHGGPVFSSMIHLIFCLRHAAQAFTLREIAGAAASRPASDNRWREAAGDNGGPLSVT